MVGCAALRPALCILTLQPGGGIAQPLLQISMDKHSTLSVLSVEIPRIRGGQGGVNVLGPTNRDDSCSISKHNSRWPASIASAFAASFAIAAVLRNGWTGD